MRYIIFALLLLLTGCKSHQKTTYEALRQRSIDNQDSLKWNRVLFARDKVSAAKGLGKDAPLPKMPFPVADYNCSVANTPFSAEVNGHFIKCLISGENLDEGKSQDYHLGLFIVIEPESDDFHMGESRNCPYYTAEGWFRGKTASYNWISIASPDGFSFAMVNTKLFDLRFGKTVFIFPEADGSFTYAQLDIDPNKFKDAELYKAEVFAATPVKNKLSHK